MEHRRWGGESDGVTVTAVTNGAVDGTVRVSGELDSHGAPFFSEAVAFVLGATDGGLRIDLARCTFIDSSGLGTLVKAHRWCEERGRSFVLGAASEQVERLLDVTGVGPLLVRDG